MAPILRTVAWLVGMIAACITVVVFIVGRSSLSEIARLLSSPPWGHEPERHVAVVDMRTGELRYAIDESLEIQEVSYRLQGCSVSLPTPQPVDLDEVPVVFDDDEGTWKIRTNLLSGAEGGAELLRVPDRIEVGIHGLRDGDRVRLHVLTDQEYVTAVESKTSSRLVVGLIQVGSPGVTGFLELEDVRTPRPYRETQENMVESRLGPVAVLIVSASRGEQTRRSRPILLLRSGIRTPDDRWVIDSKAHFVLVDEVGPPLVVFQSSVDCDPAKYQGIFAYTLDGWQVFQLSPVGPVQNSLARTEPGPPGTVYFRSNFHTRGYRGCYRVEVTKDSFSPPEHVPRELCSPAPAEP